jgi:hypothetical protein
MRRSSFCTQGVLVLAVLVLTWVVGCEKTPGPVGGAAEPAFSAAIPPSSPVLHGAIMSPLEGVTTAWQPVRDGDVIPIPRGVPVEFGYLDAEGSLISWVGATETRRDGGASYAVCPVDQLGDMHVRVDATTDGGGQQLGTRTTRFTVRIVDADVAGFAVLDATVTVEPLLVRDNASNFETMQAYFGGSITMLAEVGPGHYRTSVQRACQLTATVSNPGLARLTEWRVDGVPVLFGGAVTDGFAGVGAHHVSIGPPSRAVDLQIDTYDVTIKKPAGVSGPLPEGESLTFAAVTSPPGLESQVTWLSSTKYGSALPVLGRGPSFTVQFDQSWGQGDGSVQQWLGVRADNALVEQDQVFSSMAFGSRGVTVTVPTTSLNVPANLDGNLAVSGIGVVNGSVQVTFSGPIVVSVAVANDQTVASTAGTSVDFLVGDAAHVSSVRVNGVLTPLTTLVSQFAADAATGNNPATWSPLGRIMLGMLALEMTPEWRADVSVERSSCPVTAHKAEPGFWCRLDAAVGSACLLLLVAGTCAALLAPCGAATTITFGGVVFLCVPLIAAWATLATGGAAGLYAYIISIWC